MKKDINVENKYKKMTLEQLFKVCDKYGGINQCDGCPLLYDVCHCYLCVVDDKIVKKNIKKEYKNISLTEAKKICNKYNRYVCCGCPLKYIEKGDTLFKCYINDIENKKDK